MGGKSHGLAEDRPAGRVETTTHDLDAYTLAHLAVSVLLQRDRANTQWRCKLVRRISPVRQRLQRLYELLGTLRDNFARRQRVGEC